MLFGKNSDRHRNEAQVIEYFPSVDHEPDAQLSCTHVAIPQALRTHAVLLCRPFWIWGAEMGANEHGVVIGNEGLRARAPSPQADALIGMDLIRLGLERGSTAREAVEVMTQLLQRYGQGGNCGYFDASYYHNGFAIADSSEAFVLETVGREWLLERSQGVRTISNGYSIEHDPYRISEGLECLLRDCGWNEPDKPNYAHVIESPDSAHIGNFKVRQARSAALLNRLTGRLDVAAMIGTLRDHGNANQSRSNWYSSCVADSTLCMHAGAHDRPAQTVGSMVSELHQTRAVHWVTGTASPCISIFKPVFVDKLPEHGPVPTDRFDARASWWRHERLHRAAVLGDLESFLEHIGPERDALEAEFRAQVRAVAEEGTREERARTVARCWQEAAEMEERWFAMLPALPVNASSPSKAEWLKMNQLAGIGLEHLHHRA